MIKILIVDDNPIKAAKVTESLEDFDICSIDVASDIVSARKYLVDSYDLLIIDMNLPERFNESPKENKGIDFLIELKSSKRLIFPKNIIALTEYVHIYEKYNREFAAEALFLISYSESSRAWVVALNEQIKRIIKAESIEEVLAFSVDIVFIAALRNPELEVLLKKEYSWKMVKIPNDPTVYYSGKISSENGRIVSIAAVSLPQMGMISAACTTTKVINIFKPKFIIMIGICGGIQDKVNLGDVVIADLSFDFGSGKIVKDDEGGEKFEPDFKAIPLDGEYKEEIIEFSSSKSVLRGIQDKWQGNNPKNDFSIVVGPIGSGAAVIANEVYTERIRAHQRKLVAIDMETYAIFYCCEYANSHKPKAISIKSVSDFANSEKNDDMQRYCSFLSVEVAEYIILNILKI